MMILLYLIYLYILDIITISIIDIYYGTRAIGYADTPCAARLCAVGAYGSQTAAICGRDVQTARLCHKYAAASFHTFFIYRLISHVCSFVFSS